MWEDIGRSDWLFDLDDESQSDKVLPAVLDMALNPESSRQKAKKARQFVEKRQGQTMRVLSNELKRSGGNGPK